MGEAVESRRGDFLRCSGLYGPGGQEGLHIVFVEVPAAVGVTVEMGQPEAGLQLAADLLLNAVGELDPIVIGFQQGPLIGIFQGMKGRVLMMRCSDSSTRKLIPLSSPASSTPPGFRIR